MNSLRGKLQLIPVAVIVFFASLLGSTSASAVVSDGSPIAGSITAGEAHTCALLDSGTIRCWGANNYGQLGIGDTDTAAAGPHRVDGVHQPAVITARWFQTCVITEAGALYCWGDNRQGQLGHGSTDPHSAVPVAPVGL